MFSKLHRKLAQEVATGCDTASDEGEEVPFTNSQVVFTHDCHLGLLVAVLQVDMVQFSFVDRNITAEPHSQPSELALSDVECDPVPDEVAKPDIEVGMGVDEDSDHRHVLVCIEHV